MILKDSSRTNPSSSDWLYHCGMVPETEPTKLFGAGSVSATDGYIRHGLFIGVRSVDAGG